MCLTCSYDICSILRHHSSFSLAREVGYVYPFFWLLTRDSRVLMSSLDREKKFWGIRNAHVSAHTESALALMPDGYYVLNS